MGWMTLVHLMLVNTRSRIGSKLSSCRFAESLFLRSNIPI